MSRVIPVGIAVPGPGFAQLRTTPGPLGRRFWAAPLPSLYAYSDGNELVVLLSRGDARAGELLVEDESGAVERLRLSPSSTVALVRPNFEQGRLETLDPDSLQWVALSALPRSWRIAGDDASGLYIWSGGRYIANSSLGVSATPAAILRSQGDQLLIGPNRVPVSQEVALLRSAEVRLPHLETLKLSWQQGVVRTEQLIMPRMDQISMDLKTPAGSLYFPQPPLMPLLIEATLARGVTEGEVRLNLLINDASYPIPEIRPALGAGVRYGDGVALRTNSGQFLDSGAVFSFSGGAAGALINPAMSVRWDRDDAHIQLIIEGSRWTGAARLKRVGTDSYLSAAGQWVAGEANGALWTPLVSHQILLPIPALAQRIDKEESNTVVASAVSLGTGRTLETAVASLVYYPLTASIQWVTGSSSEVTVCFAALPLQITRSQPVATRFFLFGNGSLTAVSGDNLHYQIDVPLDKIREEWTLRGASPDNENYFVDFALPPLDSSLVIRQVSAADLKLRGTLQWSSAPTSPTSVLRPRIRSLELLPASSGLRFSGEAFSGWSFNSGSGSYTRTISPTALARATVGDFTAVTVEANEARPSTPFAQLYGTLLPSTRLKVDDWTVNAAETATGVYFQDDSGKRLTWPVQAIHRLEPGLWFSRGFGELTVAGPIERVSNAPWDVPIESQYETISGAVMTLPMDSSIYSLVLEAIELAPTSTPYPLISTENSATSLTYVLVGNRLELYAAGTQIIFPSISFPLRLAVSVVVDRSFGVVGPGDDAPQSPFYFSAKTGGAMQLNQGRLFVPSSPSSSFRFHAETGKFTQLIFFSKALTESQVDLALSCLTDRWVWTQEGTPWEIVVPRSSGDAAPRLWAYDPIRPNLVASSQLLAFHDDIWRNAADYAIVASYRPRIQFL